MELVQSQKNLNSQLLGLRSLEHPKSRLARDVVYNPLETPAPRSKLPAAAEREESPTGLLTQICLDCVPGVESVVSGGR